MEEKTILLVNKDLVIRTKGIESIGKQMKLKAIWMTNYRKKSKISIRVDDYTITLKMIIRS